MTDGIYSYVQVNNPYDVGTLVVRVKDTEKSLQLNIIEKNTRFSSHIDALFGNKEKVIVNKQRSPHSVVYGEHYFVIYPNRMGCPLYFEEIREQEV